MDRPRSGHQRPATHLPGGAALVGASLICRMDGDLRTGPDTTHGVLGKGSHRGWAWAQGRSGKDALQGFCARKRPLPGRCLHRTVPVAQGGHGGPRMGVLFGAVPPTCFHACQTLSPSQPTSPQMPRPGPTPTREPSLAPSCPPLPPASLGPFQDTPSQLRPNIPGSPGRSARSLGELPQPNRSHSVGPQICSHAPSAGTTRSWKPTGLFRVPTSVTKRTQVLPGPLWKDPSPLQVTGLSKPQLMVSIVACHWELSMLRPQRWRTPDPVGLPTPQTPDPRPRRGLPLLQTPDLSRCPGSAGLPIQFLQTQPDPCQRSRTSSKLPSGRYVSVLSR